jgi:pyrroline-5-carboxylate reductase
MKGAVRAGRITIIFTDADKRKAEKLAEELGGRAYTSNTEAVRDADAVFLAVKPQVLQTALEEIAPLLKEGKKTTVSMAAGWSIAKIQGVIGVAAPVIRIMPNTPALVGQGLIAFCASPETHPEKIDEIRRLLAPSGLTDALEEKYFDAVTGLSGSGPAFVSLFIEALADGGVFAGLPRDKAFSYAVQTVLGAAAMLKETGMHPAQLKDMVASPAGTTIAGIAALENGAFRGTVMNAVFSAFQRAEELG